MPLPLIVPIAAGLVGAFGAGKAVKALSDNSDADDINSDARRTVRQAELDLEEAKQKSNSSLEELGRKKLGSMTKTLPNFVAEFEQLKNVDFISATEQEKLLLGDFDKPALQEIKNDCSLLEGTATGLGSGVSGGALAAFGAYNGTMMLATAGTGTAISSLSGAAATNATLAWLGGGTLASGGLGVAGGTMVLGTLAAGPALLIFGSVLGAKADKNLSDARSNREQANAFANESDAICVKLDGIYQISQLASDVLSKARTTCRRATQKLAKIIKESGTDFSRYTDEQKEHVFKTVKSAQLVKSIIDVPILDKDGAILGDAEAKLAKFSDFI